MIEFSNVSKRYTTASQYHAVNDVTFSVAKGELLVLFGESGSGKTTTLKMINRLLDPTSGQIKIENQDIASLDKVTLRRKIGYVIQGVGLFPHMTIAENISIIPDLMGWSKEKTEKKVLELFELIGFKDRALLRRKPSELSGGQQQRVGIARALASGSKILLMDEPFGALDPLTKANISEEFLKIQKELSLTVIMVTHDIMDGLLFADKIAVMREGKLESFGTPREMINQTGSAYVSELLDKPFAQIKKITKIIDNL
ncbi:MAG: ATP-binding cassette domain-containing protein [Calditrichaeota bacterium]|nr:MAG: ATP-binding cassette domain-containing protein [Calditrichota bacterium]